MEFLYNNDMKRSLLLLAIVIGLTIFSDTTRATDSSNFAGEYADKKFMSGQAVLQLSLEQSGNKVAIFFAGVRHDGQGAAPEFNTGGTVSSKGIVEFKFVDDLKNSGTGTIRKAGEDVLLSIKATRVGDSRCLQFYKENMRLKHVKK
jgi:hypothetical protein